MWAQRLWRGGWFLVLFAGCDKLSQLLPPPPPPVMRTAPPLTPPPAQPAVATTSGAEKIPRGPDSAPEEFQVEFETTKGTFVVDVHRDWAPRGADRFYQLVNEGYYDGCRFFRVMPNFVVQWGMNGDPALNQKYQNNKIPDDRFSQPNRRGTIVFATSGENSRTSQLFINLADNVKGGKSDLDSQNFTPFGEVTQGMEDVVLKITSEYTDQPEQQLIAQVGNVYLDERFPNLDHIIKAKVVTPTENSAADSSTASTTDPEQSAGASNEQQPETEPESPADALSPANSGA
ncbi:MAG: peptidylprolyl isomerase [Planctomycetaceae bacterium]